MNERLLTAQGKTIELQSRIIAGSFEGEEKEVLRAVKAYTNALTLLDNYDHQSLTRPEGSEPVYHMTYEECRNIIDHMEYAGKTDVFGIEKESGKVEGILAAVYQNVFGQEVYPSLEEKAGITRPEGPLSALTTLDGAYLDLKEINMSSHFF